MAEVYVIDDDEAVRKSLTFMLRSAGMLVRTYEGAEEFLREAEYLAPGCVITDMRMPEMDGLELMRRLKVANLPLPTIMMTGHGDVAMAVEAMKLGAVDFIEKPFREEDLFKSIAQAQVADASPRATPATPQDNDVFAVLTAREREVLKCVVAGLTNKEIAREFDISPRTVEAHRAHVMSKVGAASLSELVRMAIQAGL
jgi:two-component system response regulator FixJ